MVELSESELARLRAAADRSEITQSLFLFHRIVDVTRVWDGFDDVFLPNARLSYAKGMGPAHLPGDNLVGVAAIKEWMAAAVPPSDRGGHIMANILIDLMGDKAQHSSTVAIGYATSETIMRYIGRYEASWVRTPAGWRIERMTFDRMMDPIMG